MIQAEADRVKAIQKELTAANEKLQDVVNSIPGGVAVYKVTDIFETQYFSDGVPELTGYTTEEYRELTKQDAAEMTYWEDTPMVIEKAREVIESRGIATFEFRKQHRNGNIVWVRVQMKWAGEEDGCPLLHCVFHNISDFKEAQLEVSHLINSIPGGIASYQIEGGRFIPVFFSDGVLALSGHTREEFKKLIRNDALDIIYEGDRNRVMGAARAAVKSGDVLDVSYRMRHKNGDLIWIHLNGRRMGPLAETMKFYAVFTGMSAEAQLFQSIANETADGIYVIDKNSYDLLYVNESKKLFHAGTDSVGRKCYEALYGKQEPCEFCILKNHTPDEMARAREMEVSGRFFSASFKESNWNGIPAYVKYIKDITQEVQNSREKARLEEYFETLVKNLPGGVAVIRCKQDGTMVPEFMSEGFYKMTGMKEEEVWELYRKDAMTGVHPEDLPQLRQQISDFFESGEEHCQIIYRLRKGNGGYLWVKNTISIIHGEDGESLIYANYHDITREREEQEQLRRKYKELLVHHYQMPGPDVLMLGHCNITQNVMLEINDQTDSDLLKTFGENREQFFSGMAGLIVDEEERKTFLNRYMNRPALQAFREGETEVNFDCFMKLPREKTGRYVRFTMNLVEEPDTGDITGILTIRDITSQTIEDLILHQLSSSSYDFVIDLNLEQDCFHVLAGNKTAVFLSERQLLSEQRALMLQKSVVPRDRKRYAEALDPVIMRKRLEESGTYTFFFSMEDGSGEIRTKNITVSPVDLRLGRVCMVRTDITDSVREQQRLLNVVAYTFELLVIIRVETRQLTLHTRQTILENLPPFTIENYSDASMERLAEPFCLGGDDAETMRQFRLEVMLEKLERQPAGYDFVAPYTSEEGLRYKQVNVLWGDETHSTVCLMRADVTDMLAEEHRTKEALEKALTQAEAANLAKSNFLSSMSHDIRTPMNAIIGMTSLARVHINEPERLEDCLQKISYSSNHLLSLINDILDMSKIERAKITLNRERLSLPELAEQLANMMEPQAQEAGLSFDTGLKEIHHPYFYGDLLRINQVLINILGNAIKFTPAGGAVKFLVEELPDAGTETRAVYQFTVSDTGIGMPEHFLNRIFEPFSRSSQAAYVEGTGLGLSITKGLVDLMKGRIEVESKENQGTVFRVILELETAPDGEQMLAETQTAAALLEDGKAIEGCRFLVAEDNAINAEILCELLKMYGAAFEVRTDGSEAVKAFRESKPGTFDAILMDIQMPVMNGYDAARAIRRLERADAVTIPIVAMTANAFAEDVQMALEAGMNAHVAKPIDVPKFLSALGRVMEKY